MERGMRSLMLNVVRQLNGRQLNQGRDRIDELYV